MVRVAVIGGGIAGMGAAAQLVQGGCSVVLYEREPVLGGNCCSVPVPGQDGRIHRVDLGVSDFNRRTFRACAELFDLWKLELAPISQDACFFREDGQWLLHAPQGGAMASFHAGEEISAEEVLRFRRLCPEVLEDRLLGRLTVRQYLHQRGFSQRFATGYLLPRARGWFACDADPGGMDIAAAVRFWGMHGLVGETPPDRFCIVGGMHSYVAHFVAWYSARGGTLRLGAGVEQVRRDGGRVRLEPGGERFDHLVLAVAPNAALQMLTDADEGERVRLSRVPIQPAQVVAHQDPSLLPGDRARWGAFNYLVGEGLPTPTITFWPNRLARLEAEVPDVFVTVNPVRPPRPETVLCERSLFHPIAIPQARAAVRAILARQGHRQTWYCGSWLDEPFLHENALWSGLRAGASLQRTLAGPLSGTGG